MKSFGTHYSGTLTGRSSVHAVRDGTKSSGISCRLGSDRGRIFVRIYHEKGKDIAEVWHTTGIGKETCLYKGALD